MKIELKLEKECGLNHKCPHQTHICTTGLLKTGLYLTVMRTIEFQHRATSQNDKRLEEKLFDTIKVKEELIQQYNYL